MSNEEQLVEVRDLRETYATLRVLDDGSARSVRDSLLRHGQLLPLAVYRADGVLEVMDGFKRLRAARTLGWPHLRVRVLPGDLAAAKAAIGILNHGRGLSELEEAWLVRSLYREQALTQPQIGQLLGRHKSWVSRRLLLAEGLDEVVQADVRLGLLAARTAEALARLPRVNQRPAAEGVMKRGLTHAQTERLVREVLAATDAERTVVLAGALLRAQGAATPAACASRRVERAPGQWLMADVETLTRSCARIQARLWARPLPALAPPAARLVTESLAGLLPVLTALHESIERATKEGRHAGVEDPRRV